MKKYLLILLFSIISTLGIFATISNDDQQNLNNITLVKLHIPATVRIFDETDTSYLNIRTKNNMQKYIKYDINDTVVNIKLINGNYNDWNMNICPEDIYINIGVPDVEQIKITTSNDLVISDYKNIKVSNHETN